jgi:hypothetical protein
MTLTQKLEGEEAGRIEIAARAFLAESLFAPTVIDRVAVFAQPAPTQPFTVIAAATFPDAA